MWKKTFYGLDILKGNNIPMSLIHTLSSAHIQIVVVCMNKGLTSFPRSNGAFGSNMTKSMPSIIFQTIHIKRVVSGDN